MRINATVVSVQDVGKPGYSYGQLAVTPLKSGAREALVRTPIPADISDQANVTLAELVFYARGVWTGSRVFSVRRNLTGFTARQKWNNRPALTGTTKSVTVNSTDFGTEIRIDVTDHVQLFVSGAADNRGWRLTSGEATSRAIYGALAAGHKPHLEMTYVEPGEPPTDLCPDGGAVSIAKPTLTFSTPDEISALRVQIDAAADGVSPDWDSGNLDASAGVLDLAGTSYPGLALSASTSWRAQVLTELGWTGWSEWATFPRIAKPVITITSPGPVTGDKTPPITWTAPGQVSWRAQYLNAATGEVLDDSKRTTSAELDWTPEKGLKRLGQTGRPRVYVWDGVDRVATPGDPVYAVATVDTELVALGAAPGVEALVASQVGPTPVVRVAWSSTTTPDAWRVTRDGDWLDSVDSADREFLDHTATPLTEHVYQVLAVADDGVSPVGPVATITTRPAGDWLMDAETGEKILILDATIDTNMDEQAVLHTVIGDRPPVRRRSGTPPPSGTAEGLLLDSNAEDFPAAQLEATAMGFKLSDQGREYRLVHGARNVPVTIGNMTTGVEDLDDTGRQCFSISFLWWQTEWDEG